LSDKLSEKGGTMQGCRDNFSKCEGSRNNLSKCEGKSILRLFALFLVVALAIPAMAKPVSKSLNLPTQTKFGGSLLEAGNYKLLIDNTTVTVKKGKEVIAQVQGQWEPREKRNDLTSILQGPNGEVLEIRFAGERRALVIRGQ